MKTITSRSLINRKGALAASAIFVAALGLAPMARTQSFVQEGNKLVGAGAVGGALQGFVAISADGNTAIVGGPADNSAAGAAWVYSRSGGVWRQQGGKLVGTGGGGTVFLQGTSVALSGDGNTAIIGGPGDNGSHGAAWAFTRSNGVWTQQGNKLVGTGAVGNEQQGTSVAVSADGNIAIVGGIGDNGCASAAGAISSCPGVGAVWVYTRSGGVWTQQGNKLVGTGAEGKSIQGGAVALSADGNTAIVGGARDGLLGAAWVFTRSGGVWSQQGSKLNSGVLGLGYTVALSADGNTAIVGGAGAAVVFTRSGGMWTQQDQLSRSRTAAGAPFSTALSADGNTAVIGVAANNSKAGEVWVYVRSGGAWTQQGDNLVGTGAVGAAQQGTTVGLSADGSTAIEGGLADNNGAGAAWVFARQALSTPTISSGGIVNAASFKAPVARGSLATLFGSGLSSATASASSLPLPTLLGGAQVSVGGVAAPLLYVSPSQINFQVPFEEPINGTIPVIVTRDGTPSASQLVEISEYAPGVFTYARNATTLDPIIVHLDSRLVTPSDPASSNEILTIYATGVGSFDNPPATGAPSSASPLANAKVLPIVTVGGAPVQVLFAGLTPGFVGLVQINIKLPTIFVPSALSLPIVVQFPGGSSQSLPLNLGTTPLTGSLTVSFSPNPVTTGSDGKWHYAITLQETGGVGITLTKFTINQSDLTSMIQPFFGSLHVGLNGALKANLVSSGSGDLTFTFSGTDDRGHAGAWSGTIHLQP